MYHHEALSLSAAEDAVEVLMCATHYLIGCQIRLIELQNAGDRSATRVLKHIHLHGGAYDVVSPEAREAAFAEQAG
jgi:hypothetical protein